MFSIRKNIFRCRNEEQKNGIGQNGADFSERADRSVKKVMNAVNGKINNNGVQLNERVVSGAACVPSTVQYFTG